VVPEGKMILLDGVPVPHSLVESKSTLGLQTLMAGLTGKETITYVSCEVDPRYLRKRMKRLVETGCLIYGVNKIRR
jgi:hypothetical protein